MPWLDACVRWVSPNGFEQSEGLSDNLLVNPDFETGLDPWYAWGGSIELSTEHWRAGGAGQSCKYTTDGTTTYSNVQSDYISVTEGDHISLSAWCFPSQVLDSGVSLSIAIFDADHTYITTYRNPVSIDVANAWHELKQGWDIEAGTSYITYVPEFIGQPSSNEIWIDHLSLKTGTGIYSKLYFDQAKTVPVQDGSVTFSAYVKPDLNCTLYVSWDSYLRDGLAGSSSSSLLSLAGGQWSRVIATVQDDGNNFDSLVFYLRYSDVLSTNMTVAAPQVEYAGSPTDAVIGGGCLDVVVDSMDGESPLYPSRSVA